MTRGRPFQTGPLPFLATLTAAVLTGCGGGSTVGAPESTLRRDMGYHFEQAGLIRMAIVRGQLDDVVEPARALAEHTTTATVPPTADAYLADMRRLARLTADSPDLDGAAEAVSRMGRTCGSCHSAHRAGPQFGPAQEPRDAHMTRHAWGFDRMWEALISASDTRWTVGARAMAETDFELPAGAADDARKLAAEATSIGRSADQADDWGNRTRLYGELLSTCASCHDAVGVVTEELLR